MLRIQFPRIVGLLSMLLVLACFALQAAADNDDPPTRVARMAYAQGSVSFQPSGTDDWVTPAINRPMTIGDKIWSDNDGRVELQLDASLLSLSNNTGISFLNLNDNATQIDLSAGTLLLRVRRLDPDETYEIDAPNLAFSVLRPGLYRITVDESGDSTAVTVRSGEGEVTGRGGAYSVHARESYVFSGSEQLYATREDQSEDQFDTWAAMRDRRWETSRSARYVSTDVIGYDDLDDHGDWRPTPDYGNVWFPRVTSSDWAPYHYGHWAYIEPWGYTWVDDEPWGFAPFHYGRWVNYHGAWGWVPAPPRAEGVAYVPPVYAPALVAWVGGGTADAAVAWFPLGPREVYVPSYPVSRNYLNNVNVSNTTVNTTIVNNYYNTTIINKSTTVTNVNYVNRSVPGAVAATTPQVFTSAQPVAKNLVKVDQRSVASAPVRASTPPVVPAKQAVLGNVPATARPPANVQTRTVVAKATPPPPPPSFEKRQAAIKNNGGKPLSPTQMRQIQPAPSAASRAPVKVAPAAKPAATPPPPPPSQPAPSPNAPTTKPEPNPTPAPNRPSPAPNSAPQPNRPAERPTPPPPTKPEPTKPPAPTPAQPNRPPERAPEPPAKPPNPNKPPAPPATNRTAPAARPNEQPPAARPTTPPATNPEVEKKQQQEQEQLRAKQEQERQKLQQQQQQEHARAQQQADQAKKQQLEREHQQQAEQLQQKHAQEQKQLQQKQQEEREQKNKSQKPEHPPQPQP